MSLRVRTKVGGLLTALVVLAAIPRGATAQDALDMTVLNQGKPPQVAVQISAIVNGGKQPIARTDGEGKASLPFDLLNLGKGTPVRVVLITCEGETEVVLVPEGEPNEECDRAREDPDCDCSVLGVIYWGETTSIVVDVGEVPPTLTTGPSGIPGVAPGPWVSLGLKVDAVFWPESEDVGCALLVSCTADDSSVGFVPFLEFGLGDLPFFVGMQGFYSTLSLASAGSDDPLGPDSFAGDVDVLGLGGYGGLKQWFGRFAPFVLAGTMWLRNDATFLATFPGGETEMVDRDEDGFRFLGGVGTDIGIAGPVAARLNAYYVSGGGDDFDRQVSVGAGVVVLLGSGRVF